MPVWVCGHARVAGLLCLLLEVAFKLATGTVLSKDLKILISGASPETLTAPFPMHLGYWGYVQPVSRVVELEGAPGLGDMASFLSPLSD